MRTSSGAQWCSWCSVTTSSSVSDVRDTWVIDLRVSRALLDLRAPFNTKAISSGSRSSRLTLTRQMESVNLRAFLQHALTSPGSTLSVRLVFVLTSDDCHYRLPQITQYVCNNRYTICTYINTHAHTHARFKEVDLTGWFPCGWFSVLKLLSLAKISHTSV